MPKLPRGLRIYILTQAGENKHVTSSSQVADDWLGLGNEYDYQAFRVEDYQPVTPPTEREAPARAVQEMRDVTEQSERARRDIEGLTRKFQPKSSLLR